MAQRTLTILTENGLFRPDGSSEIYCSICTTDTKLVSWEKHIIDPAHLEKLEHFNVIFEKEDSKVHCKLCNVDFDWQALKDHEQSHMIIPWHKSADKYDKYKLFFENRFIEWKNLYHCCICEATFPTWELIFVHITNPEHQNCKKKIASLVYNFPKDSISYKFLVSEGLISFGETAVECRICRSAQVHLASIDRHVKGLMHKSNKFKFSLVLNIQETEERYTEQIYENSQCTSTSEDSSSEDSMLEESALNKPTLQESTLNKPIFDESTLNKPIFDESTLNKSMLEKPTLQESTLNKPTSGESPLIKPTLQETTLDTLTSQNSTLDKSTLEKAALHEQALDKPISNGVKPRTSPDDNQKTVSQTLPCNYIVKKSIIDSYCVICNCVMLHYSVNNHVKEKDHLDSEKEYGCDKISLINGNEYRCKICDRTMIGLASVYSHVMGNKHLKCLDAWIENRGHTRPSAQVGTIKRPGEDTKKVAKSLEKSLEKNINDNITLLEKNVYYCKCCNIAIPGPENVYVHLKEKRHLRLFTVPVKQVQQILETIDNVKQTSKVSEVAYQRSPFYYYLVKINGYSFRCTICDCILSASPNNLMIHVTGNFHAESMKKYGCDEVSVTDDNLYYCRCCDIKISSLQSLQLHIKHKNHLSSLNLPQEKQPDELQSSAIPKITDIEDEHRLKFRQEIPMQSDNVKTAENVDINSNTLVKNRSSSSETSGKPLVLKDTSSFGTLRRPNIDPREPVNASNEKKNIQTKFEIPRRPKACDLPKKDVRDSSTNPSHEKQLEEKLNTIEPISQSSACNYLVQLNATNFYCEICSCAISASEYNINQHLNGSYHTKFLKKHGCNYIESKGDDIYYCKCCDIAIARPDIVYLHIKKDSHMIAVRSQSLIGESDLKKDEISRQYFYEQLKAIENLSGKLVMPKESGDETDSARQTLPSIFLQKLSATDSHCKICNIKIQDKEIEEHIASTDHAAALEKYACHRILTEGSDDYYCTCCKCNICGIENVRSHIKGRRHLFSLRDLRDKQQLQTVKRNLNELKQTVESESNSTVSVVSSEISKMLLQMKRKEKKNRLKETDATSIRR